jgi:hypothetical protein
MSVGYSTKSIWRSVIMGRRVILVSALGVGSVGAGQAGCSSGPLTESGGASTTTTDDRTGAIAMPLAPGDAQAPSNQTAKCPEILKLEPRANVGPREAFVGESILITATANGPDPSSLGYTWTMSDPIGVFGAIQPDGGVGTPGQDEAVGPSDPMQFLCTSPGKTTITVVVDDGSAAAGNCPAQPSTSTISITCDAFPSDQVESAWVEIGSGNAVIARALTAASAPDGGGNPCPNITLNGGTPQPMNLRALATTSLPLRTTIVTPNKPSIFPVSSCELTLPAGTTSAVVGGKALALPKANPQKIVVIGDTGCRMQGGSPPQFQNCNDPTQYPFGTIAALAAAQQPDLVLHVGDYQYRETECPAGMSSATGCGGSPWGYGWDSWEADFFGPGAPLLAAAPWIMVRGNHEACNRAGQGWYRFLDTNPFDPVTKNCNNPSDDTLATGGNYNDPYLVSINSSTQLVLFDTAFIPKSLPGKTSTAYMTYHSEIEAAGMLVASPPAGVSFNWWANHHPILGYQTTPVTTAAPGLTPIFNAVFPNTYLPPNINLALHGHVHTFQAIDFAQGTSADGGTYSNAATLVSGNAGDNLDIALPWPVPNGPDPGVTVASEGSAGPGSAMANSAGFGYMVLTYQSDTNSWLVTEYRVDNSVRDTCTVQASGQLSCESWGYLP